MTKKVRDESLSRKLEATHRSSDTAKKSKQAQDDVGTSLSNKTAIEALKSVNKQRRSTFVEEMIVETKRKRPTRTTRAESLEGFQPVVAERRLSTTLIVALNTDVECHAETSDNLHVASRPSSMTFRYIVSPDAQYVGGPSQSRTSIFRPTQCPPLPTAGVQKPSDQKGKDSVPHLQAVTTTATEPTKSSDFGSTPTPAAERLSASVNADDNSMLLHEQASPASAPTHHHSTPAVHVEQMIYVTLAELDRDEDVVAAATWRKSQNGFSNQTDTSPAVPDTVKTNVPYDGITKQLSEPSSDPYQENSPDQVITFSLDSYDAYDDQHLWQSIRLRGASGSVTSKKTKFYSQSHDSDVETLVNRPAKSLDSSMQPENRIDNASIRTGHQASINGVTDIRTSGVRQREISTRFTAPNAARVTPTSLPKVSIAAAEIGNSNESGIAYQTHSDTCLLYTSPSPRD